MGNRIFILTFCLLIACVNLESKNLILAEDDDIADAAPKVVEVVIDSEPFDLWDRIRKDLSFKIPDDYEDIDRYRKRFISNQHAVNRLSKSGQRYLFHTVKRAEELGIPVESQSLYGATGMWQFLPATGREWGLKTNWWYDGKRDVIASTEAAFNFLIYLHQKFDRDWLLAIAAYHAGPSRINRAIKENKRKGMATDLWSLRLPPVSSAYVPKLLVLSELIKDPSLFSVTLPSIANRPYFTKIKTPGQIDIMQAADLAGMTPEAVYELNPGFSQWATDPSGPHYLLLPTGVSDRFLIQLSSLDEVELVQWDRYKINRGDTLTRIAKKYSIEVAVLKEINQMDNDLIYAGQEIMVPRGPAWAKTFVPKARTYEVVKGDTFWGISRKFRVTIQDISLWNDLSLTRPLQIGQKIKLFSKYERVRGKTPNKKTRTMLYPVKSGDTLSRIGSRFGIKVQDLQKWNELKSLEIIYPGQVLKINLEAGVGS